MAQNIKIVNFQINVLMFLGVSMFICSAGVRLGQLWPKQRVAASTLWLYSFGHRQARHVHILQIGLQLMQSWTLRTPLGMVQSLGSWQGNIQWAGSSAAVLQWWGILKTAVDERGPVPNWAICNSHIEFLCRVMGSSKSLWNLVISEMICEWLQSSKRLNYDPSLKNSILKVYSTESLASWKCVTSAKWKSR